MKIKKLRIMMLLSALSCAALLNGCGSSSKNGSTGNIATVDEGTCIACHSTTIDPTSGLILVSEYANSAHNLTAGGPGCQGCHGPGGQHNGIGPIPFPNPLFNDPTTGKPQCFNAACHGDPGSIIPGVVATSATATSTSLNFPNQCSHCHSVPANGDVHAAQVTSVVLTANDPNKDPDDCVFCHTVAAPQHGALVNDNNGVRAIVPEFQKTSHHIVNADGSLPTKAQCAVCHAEGTIGGDGTSIVVDSTFHMKDGKIYLRNGNATLGQTPPKFTMISTTMGSNPNKVPVSVYVWNPAAPDHTLMDQFCFSCHNSKGAATAFATLGIGVNDVHLATSSATNPFGDAISNGYDQKPRLAVVNVYDQMNPSNSSHHAVRGQKYSGRTRNAADPNGRVVTNAALFTKYSGAGNARIHPNAKGVLTAYQVFGTYSTSGPASGNGPLFPGSRTTIYDAGLFVANYMTLNQQTLGDDSGLHCGDCHSVGQWTNMQTLKTANPAAQIANAIVWNSTVAASLNDYKVVPTTVAIGAHGSVNEYMLRTSDGSDSLQIQSTAQVGTTPSVNGNYVCFLCHTQYYYGDNSAVAQTNVVYGTNAVRGDFGHGGGIGPCNGLAYSGYGKKGTARYGVLVNGVATPSIGNLFGMSCAHCHNSGQQNFGGIHGATRTYMSYSTNGVDVAGNAAADAQASQTGAYLLNVTHKTSYRFMGGESIRYNGGATANKWEAQTLGKPHREGCYNLSQTTDATHLWNTTDPQTTAAGGTNAISNNTGTDTHSDSAWGVADYTFSLNGRFGQNNATSGWGSCNHHQGSTTTGPTSPTRVIQRPLVY